MNKKIDVMFREAEEILTQAKALMAGEVDDEVQAQVDELLAQAEKLQKDAERLEKLMALEMSTAAKAKQEAAAESKTGRLSDQVVNSEAYKAWLSVIAPNGAISERGLGNLPSVMLKASYKELVTGLAADSAGAFITPDDSGIYEEIGRYATVARDLIAVRSTTSDMVEFVRQTVQVNEADVVPEANVKYPIGYPGEIDGKKPQGKMNFERVQAPVETIAVYVGATKRALADAGQIRGLIDQDLRGNLNEELERYVFNIIENSAGTLLAPFDTDIFTTTRQAVTQLSVVGRQQPTAWVFHPSDWETVELTQDAENRYYYGGPINQGSPRMWGVPVVQSFFVTPGTAWLANWRKAVLWDRQQTTITATDSHEDWFIRNMVAILAEMRAAFALIRPSAFVEVELS